MERHRRSTVAVTEWAYNCPDRGMLLTAAVVGLMLAAGCSSLSKPQRVAPTPDVVRVLLPPWKPLPAEWPPAAELTNIDCRPGASISTQWPGHIGEFTTGIADGRCVVGEFGSSVGIYRQPTAQSLPVTHVPNGFFVRLDCQTPGEAVYDTRSSMGNSQWFGVTFRNPLTGNDEQGFASAASQGQLTAPLTNEVPQC